MKNLNLRLTDFSESFQKVIDATLDKRSLKRNLMSCSPEIYYAIQQENRDLTKYDIYKNDVYGAGCVIVKFILKGRKRPLRIQEQKTDPASYTGHAMGPHAEDWMI